MALVPSTNRTSDSLTGRKLYRFITLRGLNLPLLPVLVAATALVAGCIGHVHVPYSGAVADATGDSVARPASALAADHPGLAPRRPASDLVWQPLPAGELDYGWHEAFLVAKAKPCTGVVEPSAKVMLSRKPGAKRWVVLLPIWGSSIYPPRQMARRLLRGPDAADTNVLWILGPEELFDWQGMATARGEAEYVATLRRGGRCLAAAVRDVREWLDWIAARDDYDPERLGLVGFSIGAIAAALVVAEDPRPDATALVMGGGRLEHIFASCRGDARMGRDGALDRFGWDLDRFLSTAAGALAPVEPIARLERGPAVDPSTIFFVDASKDGCIPEVSRQQLWQSLGRPERLSVPYGHKMSFLSMTFLGFHHTSHRILDFLDQRFEASPRPASGDIGAELSTSH